MPHTRGTYVKDRRNDRLGRVYYSYTAGQCPYDDVSLASHTFVQIYGPNPMRFVNSAWYQVFYQADGSIGYIPEELLIEVEPFEFPETLKAYRYFSDLLKPKPKSKSRSITGYRITDPYGRELSFDNVTWAASTQEAYTYPSEVVQCNCDICLEQRGER